MVPVEGFTLEEEGDNQSEDNEGDNLLDHFQLHKAEGATVAVEAEAVGWNLGAIFKECQTPGEEDDKDEGPAGGDFHFLKLQMAVPGKCHEYVGKDQQKDCSYSFNHLTIIK